MEGVQRRVHPAADSVLPAARFPKQRLPFCQCLKSSSLATHQTRCAQFSGTSIFINPRSFLRNALRGEGPNIRVYTIQRWILIIVSELLQIYLSSLWCLHLSPGDKAEWNQCGFTSALRNQRFVRTKMILIHANTLLRSTCMYLAHNSNSLIRNVL